MSHLRCLVVVVVVDREQSLRRRVGKGHERLKLRRKVTLGSTKPTLVYEDRRMILHCP